MTSSSSHRFDLRIVAQLRITTFTFSQERHDAICNSSYNDSNVLIRSLPLGDQHVSIVAKCSIHVQLTSIRRTNDD